MDANYSFYVISIATWAPTFFGYIISVLANVDSVQKAVDLTTSAKIEEMVNVQISSYNAVWRAQIREQMSGPEIS